MHTMHVPQMFATNTYGVESVDRWLQVVYFQIIYSVILILKVLNILSMMIFSDNR